MGGEVGIWNSVTEHIEQVTGHAFRLEQQSRVDGGSINNAFLLTSAEGIQYFVKTNRTGQLKMFVAEASGLREMASSKTLKVPEVVCYGETPTQSYIVLEYLEMAGHADQSLLAEQLAAMHQVTAGEFGWKIDNTIGSTFQSNAYMASWIEFWRKHRLGFQLQLAAQNGYVGELQHLGEQLLVALPDLFAGRNIQPSMLHGDLWGGNVAGLRDGTPVIYDPALYYGDREADLAMTYLFGGFGADFYACYQDRFPVDDGFALRKTFYNSYHIINHLNMFGDGYHAQAVQMLASVLAELR